MLKEQELTIIKNCVYNLEKDGKLSQPVEWIISDLVRLVDELLEENKDAEDSINFLMKKDV
jgi:hypothetical protein